MEITIHKISVALNITSFTIVKAMMLSTLFLSIYRLSNTVYTFRGLGNNLGPLLAFYFELMVFERRLHISTSIYSSIFPFGSLLFF